MNTKLTYHEISHVRFPQEIKEDTEKIKILKNDMMRLL